VTAAVNAVGGVTVTIAGHGLVRGDRVSVLGLPGIAAPGNSGSVEVIDADRVWLAGMTMNAAYGGAGATVTGPADSWNTAYFASAGRLFGTSTLNPDRGLFRLTVTSTGELVISDNLLRHIGGPPGVFGQVAFCQSLFPRTRTLYISVQDTTPHGDVFIGLFCSDDFGATWSLRPKFATRVNKDGAEQTSYDLIIGVDPQDPRRVYAAQQQLWRSPDSGKTWPPETPVPRGGVDQIKDFGSSPSTTLLHWDHHELVFPPATRWDWDAGNPVTPTPAYHGTDGGIARSGQTAAGLMTFTALNEGIATSLLTSLDIGRGEGKNAATFAGMQDTRTGGHRSGDASGVWVEGNDGDGAAVAVDPFDPDIVFGMANGNLIRTTNGGKTWFANNLPGQVEIENVANTPEVTVTTVGHPYRTHDTVTITGVPGGGGLLAHGAPPTIKVVDARTFTLDGKNGTAVPAFGPFPTVTGDRYLPQLDIVAATPQKPIEIATATPHGCATGQKVRIDAVEGNVAANNTDARPSWKVTVMSPTRLSLNGSDGTLSPPYVPRTGRMRGPAVTGPLPVFGTVKADPIVVTAQGHGFVTGDAVTIAGEPGNTAANRTVAITVLDANSFELNGVAGNGAPGPHPRASGLSIGRHLPKSPPSAPINITRIALVPNAGGPSAKIFVSADQTLYCSKDGGITFVPMFSFTDPISALHAPDEHRLWVATSGLNGTNRRYRVHFSTTDGASFDGTAQHFVRDIGARSFISQIIEDPKSAGQRVAVVCAGYSRTATSRRTRHVFITETQGRATGGATPWHEVGGVFNATSGNLPDVPVTGAAWDTSVAPSRLLVASDSGVLRLNLAGPSWERIGPNLPRAGVQAIASDTSVNPPVVRIGTYGRSAWELTVPTGPEPARRGRSRVRRSAGGHYRAAADGTAQRGGCRSADHRNQRCDRGRHSGVGATRRDLPAHPGFRNASAVRCRLLPIGRRGSWRLLDGQLQRSPAPDRGNEGDRLRHPRRRTGAQRARIHRIRGGADRCAERHPAGAAERRGRAAADQHDRYDRPAGLRPAQPAIQDGRSARAAADHPAKRIGHSDGPVRPHRQWPGPQGAHRVRQRPGPGGHAGRGGHDDRGRPGRGALRATGNR
jgi:hypothetical protein